METQKIFIKHKTTCEICDKEFEITTTALKIVTNTYNHTCQECWNNTIKMLNEVKK